MASLDVLLTFLLAASAFAFMPGPAMIYVAAQTVARGRLAGWMAALGVSLGGMAHVLAASAGLSALFIYVPTLYAVLKLAGAAYLIWLGVSIIRTRIACGDKPQAAPPKSGRRAFLDSVTVEVLNPKTAIFFIAFLPQFADPAGTLPIWLQLLILGVVVNLMFALGDVAAILGSAFILGRTGASRRVQNMFRWLGGGAMIGLGVKLAADRT